MITQKRLKEILRYTKSTGLFHYVNNGKKAGFIKRKYVQIKIDGKVYKAHRLVWLYLYGEMPTLYIDHKNRNEQDNRFRNLREVTHKENHKNKGKFKNNTSGVTGVYRRKSTEKWYAQIVVDGKTKHLGTFRLKRDAVKARREANKQYGFKGD